MTTTVEHAIFLIQTREVNETAAEAVVQGREELMEICQANKVKLTTMLN